MCFPLPIDSTDRGSDTLLLLLSLRMAQSRNPSVEPSLPHSAHDQVAKDADGQKFTTEGRAEGNVYMCNLFQ